MLASASDDKIVKLWNTGSVAVLQILKLEAVFIPFPFSNNRRPLQTNMEQLFIECFPLIAPPIPDQILYTLYFPRSNGHVGV
jgi:hypothetical protein